MSDGAPITPGSGLGVATDEIAVALTGTVTKTAVSSTLVGVSTLFTTELSVGQIVRVPGTANEDRIISAIASDTSLTVSVNFTNTAAGQTVSRVQQYQIVKNGFGALDTATLVSTSNPFPTRNYDGSAVALDGRTRKVTATPTISTTPAYTAGDAVGGVMTFTSLFSTAGVLLSGALSDSSLQAATLELMLFSATVTATDNAAFAPTDAEALNYIGSINFDRYSTLSVNCQSIDQALGIGVVGATIYGVLVARSTPTYGSTTDLQVTLYGKSD